MKSRFSSAFIKHLFTVQDQDDLLRMDLVVFSFSETNRWRRSVLISNRRKQIIQDFEMIIVNRRVYSSVFEKIRKRLTEQLSTRISGENRSKSFFFFDFNQRKSINWKRLWCLATIFHVKKSIRTFIFCSLSVQKIIIRVPVVFSITFPTTSIIKYWWFNQIRSWTQNSSSDFFILRSFEGVASYFIDFHIGKENSVICY